VATDTLAHFMAANGIAKCHFMKLNCEGAEFPILLSAGPETLGRIGHLVVLYHSDLWGLNTEEDLCAHLQACGFSTRIINKDGQRGWIIAAHQRFS
jgi:hypothetical protein